jgi:hypothetical protein
LEFIIFIKSPSVRSGNSWDFSLKSLIKSL